MEPVVTTGFNALLAMLSGALVGAAMLAGCTDTGTSEYYVAPGGSDEDPGTEDRPFATLTRAWDAIRQVKADGLYPRGRHSPSLLVDSAEHPQRQTHP